MPAIFLFGMMLVAQIAPAQAAARSGSHYMLGRGLPVGESGITLGGYASANYLELDHQSSRFEISDLSLFLSWDSGQRWRAFSEMEIGEALIFDHDGPSTRDAEFDLERTYIDWYGRHDLNLRFGKFLTPFGHWNQVHADPLVWTVSRPLTTNAGFANHATGAMLYGDLETATGTVGFQFYIDATEKLDPRKDKPSPPLELGAFDNAFGGRLVYHSEDDSLQLGLSVADFAPHRLPGRETIAGLDFLWHRNGFELSGEWITRSDSPIGSSWFVQAVAPLGRRLYLVDRYEDFDRLGFPQEIRTNAIGLVFRPVPAISLKAEAVEGDQQPGLTQDGLRLSASVLF